MKYTYILGAGGLIIIGLEHIIIIASEYGNQLALWACICPLTLILLRSSGIDEPSNFRGGFGLNEVGITVSAVFVVMAVIIVLGLVVIIKRIRFVIIIASVIKV